MASKFWVLASISFAQLAAGLAAGQAWPSAPGLQLKPEGVKIVGAISDTLYFDHALPAMRIKRTDDAETVYQGQDFALTPSAVSVTPFRPGIKFYFPLGVRFRTSSDLGPYLSWAEGTVGPDLPTAPSSWIILTFRDGQPPFLLTCEKPVQWQASGESGRWTIAPVGDYKGWIRICAPLGPRRIGSSVEALGSTVKSVRPLAEILSTADPSLQGFRVRSEEDSLVAVWEFDRPGAMLPPPVMLTKPGGYKTQVISSATPELAEQYDGPIAFTREDRIAIRFPMRSIAQGRPICVGEFKLAVSSASGFDVPTIYELAASMLCAPPDSITQDAASAAIDEYRRTLLLNADTRPSSPRYESDVRAAQAWLGIANTIHWKAPNTDLFDGMIPELDRWTWLAPGGSLPQSVRASALFALCASLSQSDALRFRGAMAHAGAVAVSMQQEYRRRRGFDQLGEAVPRPIFKVRSTIYSSGPQLNPDPFGLALLSPVRLLGQFDLQAEKVGDGYRLSWVQQQAVLADFTLCSPYPLELEASENVASIEPVRDGDLIQFRIRPKASGHCAVILRLPPQALPLPLMPDPPRYSE